MSASSDHDDATVTYSVRDLLDQIKTEQATGFTRLETAMTNKADAADVARLEANQTHHAEHLEKVDERLDIVESHHRTLRTVLGVGLAVCTSLGGLGAFLAAIHAFG